MSTLALDYCYFIRRTCDRGIALALQRDDAFIDSFQHIKDEIARLEELLTEESTENA